MSEQEITTQILDKISRLNLGELAELIEAIKDKYKISGEIVMASPAVESQGSEESKEKGGNVSLKLTGLKEVEGVTKVQAYKIIADIAKSAGKDINIIQAKKLAEEGGLLVENIASDKAKEITSQLEAKGVQVAVV